MTISPAQCRAARALLNISQSDLAARAQVARATVTDFERGSRTPTRANLAALTSALESAGVAFTDGEAPGVRLRVQP